MPAWPVLYWNTPSGPTDHGEGTKPVGGRVRPERRHTSLNVGGRGYSRAMVAIAVVLVILSVSMAVVVLSAVALVAWVRGAIDKR